MPVEFRPSEVSLTDSFPPLVATMGRAELESAATLLVRAFQVRGDAWQDVQLGDLLEVMRHDADGGVEPLASMVTNPFIKPDFWGLIEGGFAAAILVEKKLEAIRFTAEGLERLRKVVQRSPVRGATA